MDKMEEGTAMADRDFNYMETEEYLNHNAFMKYKHMEIVKI